MTDDSYTHLLLVADTSGSMNTIASDMNGGIATLLKEQSELPGTLLVDAWTFDSTTHKIVDNTDPNDARLVNLVRPGTATALYDGIGFAVKDLGEHLAALPEERRPSRIVVVIVTDGHENASKEYTIETVKAIVTEQQDVYGWQFMFLGANIDSFAVGGGIGLRGGSTIDFQANEQSVGASWGTTSSLLSAYRGGVTASMAYTEEDRKKVGETPEAPTIGGGQSEQPKSRPRNKKKDSK